MSPAAARILMRSDHGRRHSMYGRLLSHERTSNRKYDPSVFHAAAGYPNFGIRSRFMVTWKAAAMAVFCIMITVFLCIARPLLAI